MMKSLSKTFKKNTKGKKKNKFMVASLLFIFILQVSGVFNTATPLNDGDDGDYTPPTIKYYQLGLEFSVRPEDIDVLLTVGLYQNDEATWIEDIALAPIGLSVSVNDYKSGNTFFLDMFYGDADYNITMSGVITANEATQMTVYICNVAAEELLDVTWIEDGSGIKWDYE